MQLKFNVSGQDRKKLVVAIADEMGVKQKYLGMPTMNYEVGDLTIDTVGTVTSEVEWNKNLIEKLVDNLKEKGFKSDMEKVEEFHQESENCFSQTTIVMPSQGFDDKTFKNLNDLIEQKKDLIRRAFNLSNVEVIDDNSGKILFPWFKGEVDYDTLKAYTVFIEKLCILAKSLKRTNSKTQEEIINEKYAFRCFLLRLGFIGDKYKSERKILLENLEGSSSYKRGVKNELSK